MKKSVLPMIAACILLSGCSDNSGITINSTSSDNSSSKSNSEPQSSAVSSSEQTSSSDNSSLGIPDPTDADLSFALEIIRDTGCVVGAAFVGYIDSEMPETEIRKYLESSETIKNYSYLSNASLVCREGAELYALTPLEGYSITVYSSELTEDGSIFTDKSAPLYRGKTGECIILRCNISEVYSNVLIEVSNGADTLEFQPEISLENGQMVDKDRCYDLSVYMVWDDLEKSGYESLLGNSELSSLVSQGMALRYIGETVDLGNGLQGVLFALGTDVDGQFVSERFYAFEPESETSYYLDGITGEWKALSEG